MVVNNQKKLLQKKEMVFTKNGRIYNSETVDTQGNKLQETEKKLMYIIEKYPDRQPLRKVFDLEDVLSSL